MIDREKLIALMIEAKKAYTEDVLFSKFLADFLIANGVTFATDTKVGDKWTPTADRVPFAEYGESDDVLAITELGVMRTLYFDGGNWCFQNGECCPHKVTHWMPLPEPPKEE